MNKHLSSHKFPITSLKYLIRGIKRILGDLKLLVKKLLPTRKKRLLALAAIVLILVPIVAFTLLNMRDTQAAWWPGGSAWAKRQRVPVVNNSGATLSADTTIAITLNTKQLVEQGRLKSDCSDLRVLYQPNNTTATDLPRYLSYPGGATCATSEATRVSFPLQATLNSAATSTHYYMYYSNGSASSPSSTVDAFDTSSANALLVCSFDGTTECINGDGAESPTTETGAIRYSGSKSALNFDGDDYVNAGNSTSIQNLPEGAFTAEAWFKLDRALAVTEWANIIDKSGSYDFNWHLAISNEYGYSTRIESTIDNIANSFHNSSSISLNTWHHIAMTYNDNDGVRKIRLFLDGSEVTYGTQTAMTGSYAGDTGVNLYIGGSDGEGAFPGKIDEVRISNIARYTSNFTPQTAPFIRDEHTKLLYHFDENGVDPRNTGKAIDDSGNANHGTITGAKYVGGLVGIDGPQTLSGVEGSVETGKAEGGNAYAGHEGIFIEEATTNKITNPSFEHGTYDTGWTKTQTLTVQPNGDSGDNKDTWFFLGNPDHHNGSQDVLVVQSSTYGNVLLSFDLSAIPDNSVCDNATLYLYGSDDRLNDHTVEIHPVLAANDGWPVGTTADPGTGYSTWNHHTEDTQEWAGGENGCGVEDTDYSATSIGGWTIPAHTPGLYSSSLTCSEVEKWFGSTNENYGMFLVTNSIRMTYSSMNNATAENRPKLVVTYTSPLTVTENTTAPYFKFGETSVKLDATDGTSSYITSIDPNSTASHTLSAYVYNGTSGSIGGTVDATVAKLITEGTTQTTTYTDMGGGWWRLSFIDSSVADAAGNWGVEVQNGKTIYFDGVQLEAKAYATTYADGSLESDAGGNDTYFWDDDCDGTLDAGEDEVEDQHTQCSSRTRNTLTYPSSGNVDADVGSVSLWYKPESLPTNEINFLGGTGALWLYKGGGENTLRFAGTGQAYPSAAVNHTLEKNKWVHMVGTWNSSTGVTRLYVNNGTPGTRTATWTPGALGAIEIGSRAAQTGYHVNGNISDLRLYDTELSSTEVADLYYSGLVSRTDSYELDRFGGTDEDPVAIYHFDEGYGTTVHDSTVNGNHLTAYGATWNVNTASSANAVGMRSLQYDGTNDSASSSAALTGFNFGSDPFSVSGWFRHSSTISGTDTLISQYASSGYKVYMNSSGFICAGIDDDSTWGPDDEVCSSTSYADSSWHHVEMVKGATTLTLYVDANAVGSKTITATGNLSPGAPLYLGADNNSSNFWDGSIDELYFYSYARSTDQIKVDYNLRSAAVFGTSTSDNLSDGLVGYWKMDEASWTNDCSTNTVMDSSGNGNHGQSCPASTGPTGGTAGKYGNSGDFDGSNDYVNIGNPTTLQLTGAMTVSAWVNYDTTDDNTRIVSKSGGGGSRSWEINIENTNPDYYRFSIGTDSGSTTVVAQSSTNDGPELGKWTHITGVYEPSKYVRLYKNGVLIAENTNNIPSSQWNNSNNVNIGARGGGLLHNGKIDEARVYNRALSPAEVTQLYNWAPGPVAYYKFDEGHGQYAYDSSGNENTGTLGSGTSPDSYDPSWNTGKFGSALEFDGNDDYVDAGSDSTIVDIFDGGGTVSFWIKPKGNAASNSRIFNKGTSSRGWLLLIQDCNSTNLDLVFRNNTSSIDSTFRADCVLNINQWNHVVVNYDDDSNTNSPVFYVNGIQKTLDLANNSDVAYVSDVADPLSIGGAGENLAVDGFLDDIRLYNYARTSEQIVSDMNAGHPAPGSPVGSAIGHWKFDEGYGDTAYNSGSGGSSLNGDLGLSTTCPGHATCPVWSNDGKLGKSLSFSGSSQPKLITPLLTNLTDNMAISTWVKWDGNASRNQNIYLNGVDGSNGWELRINNPSNYIDIVCEGVDTATTTTQLTTGTWHHIVTQRKNGTWELYLDTKPVDVGGTSTCTPNTPTTRTVIGSVYGQNLAFKGLVDEFKVYNTTLTQDQINTEYNMSQATVFGATSTDSSGVGTWSATDAYCPPGQTTACVGPIAEWKFDEKTGTSANDTSGNGNTGTLTSSPTWKSIAQCKIGACLEFNGSSNYVDTTDINGLDGTNKFSISAWAYFNSLGDWDTIVSKYSSASNNISLQLSGSGEGGNNDFNIAVMNGGNTQGYTTGNIVTTGRWYHLHAVYDGTQSTNATKLKLYVDGVQQTLTFSGTIPTTTGSNSSTVKLGFENASGTYLDGRADEVRIYDYARTQSQVAWEYNRGGPVGWWKMDENVSGNGQTIYDSSGNTNNGITNWGANASGMDCTVAGKRNSACDFDGTDDYISVPDSGSWDITTMTVSAWIKPSDVVDYRTIISKFTSTQKDLYFFVRSGLGCLALTGVQNNDLCPSTLTIPVDQWTHIAFSYDGSYLKFFKNGIINATYSLTGTPTLSTNSNPLYIGYNTAWTDEVFEGLIDEVKVFNYPLTPEQIKLDHAGAAVKFGQ
jgi:hypothetical protein